MIAAQLTDNNIVRNLVVTLSYIGKTIVWWDEKKKPIYDLIDEKEVDLLILDGRKATQLLSKALLEFKGKIISVGLNQLVKADLLLIGERIPPNILKNLLCDYLVVKDAANPITFRGGFFNRDYETDILVVDTGKEMDQALFSGINCLKDLPHNFRVIGPKNLPTPYFVGVCDFPTISSCLHSSNIVITYNWQTALDIAIHKVFVLTNSPNKLVPYFQDNDSLKSQIAKFQSEKLRRKVSKDIVRELKQNTWLHRIESISDKLGVGWKIEEFLQKEMGEL